MQILKRVAGASRFKDVIGRERDGKRSVNTYSVAKTKVGEKIIHRGRCARTATPGASRRARCSRSQLRLQPLKRAGRGCPPITADPALRMSLFGHAAHDRFR